MSEISRKEAIVLLKDHHKWTQYSWIDDICEYALKDIEKLEKIKQLFALNDFAFVEDCGGCPFEEDEDCFDSCENYRLFKIKQILKEVEE